MRFLWQLTKWGLVALFFLVIALAAPVAYVAAACKGTPGKQDYPPIITEPEFQRQEANSFLTYPEWHIVYAYEGLARALETGDEYEFAYFSSIKGFWSAACALNKVAAAHGGADVATVRTNYVLHARNGHEGALRRNIGPPLRGAARAGEKPAGRDRRRNGQ
jgi:hypothetical protein